jgi:hypothetical protein
MDVYIVMQSAIGLLTSSIQVDCCMTQRTFVRCVQSTFANCVPPILLYSIQIMLEQLHQALDQGDRLYSPFLPRRGLVNKINQISAHHKWSTS